MSSKKIITKTTAYKPKDLLSRDATKRSFNYVFVSQHDIYFYCLLIVKIIKLLGKVKCKYCEYFPMRTFLPKKEDIKKDFDFKVEQTNSALTSTNLTRFRRKGQNKPLDCLIVLHTTK